MVESFRECRVRVRGKQSFVALPGGGSGGAKN